MHKYASTLILVATAALAAPVAVADDPKATNADGEQRVTDFKGRPPFSRNRAPADTIDLARFEETEATDVVKRADFRGRPPFSRHAAPPRVTADFARFEESDRESPVRRRVGPPGKMNARR